MRRFIKTTLGKLLSNAVALSLIIPYVAVLATPKAEAQLQDLPQWAVLDMVDKTGKAPASLGATAAEAIRNELGKTGKYETFPAEQISRACTTLNLVTPVTQPISLLRLGAELKATTIVTSELHLFRFVNEGSLRRADVMVTIKVLDVASGINVNGSSVISHSTLRPADTSDEVLLADAIQTASAEVVRNVTSKELPVGTVLNTYDTTAFINRGARSGFKVGQELIVTRGREQVATAVVAEVEPDTSRIKIMSSPKGVQPGDKCRAIFSEPPIKPIWPKNDSSSPKFESRKTHGRNSGFYTLVTVLGLIAVAVLTSSGDQNAAASVRAEAMSDSSGAPRVQVSWSADMFSKGTDRRVQWWVFRDDIAMVPALVTDGQVVSVVDNDQTRIPNFPGSLSDPSWIISQPGGASCTTPELPGLNVTDSVNGIQSGIPYTYQVALVYRVLGIELPNPDETNNWCYFHSAKTVAKGTATPYSTPTLAAPAANEEVTGPITFTFNSVGNALAPGVVVEYIVQISSTPTFTKKTNIATFRRPDVGTVLTVGPMDLSAYYVSSNELYWRVGVRNVADNPGPKPDVYTKERYIFSVVRRLVRL